MNEQMEFPEAFEKFAEEYGFKDDKEVYTNGSDLIPIFRVKQWLEHISTTKTESEVHCNYTKEEVAKSFIEDVEAVKDLLPRAESEDKK